MKGKVAISNKKTVCSTYFEILSHMEEILIYDRDVLKFVICVGVAIVITFPGGHKAYLRHCLYLVTSYITNPV